MLFTVDLLNAFSGTGVSDAANLQYMKTNKSIQAIVDAGTATVVVQVSNTGKDNDWLDFYSMTPALSAADGISKDIPWLYMRAKVTASTGKVTVNIGGENG